MGLYRFLEIAEPTLEVCTGRVHKTGKSQGKSAIRVDNVCDGWKCQLGC